MNELLDQIVTNTSYLNQKTDEICVKNKHEFLSVAKITEVGFKDKKLKNTEEKFYFGIFRELLKEAKFFYGQYKASGKLEYSKDYINQIKNRLELILESIKESFPATKKYYWELIEADVSPDIETAIFAVSCFARDTDNARDSSRLYETFAACPSDKLGNFVTAFKYSINQELDNKIHQVAISTTRPEVKQACKKIINFQQMNE